MSNSELETIKLKLNSAKSVMVDNINSVIDRGDQLYDIDLKTDDIVDDAIVFNQRSNSIKNKFKFKIIALALIVLLFLLAIVITIIIIIINTIKK